jgi:hypothetical protein
MHITGDLKWEQSAFLEFTIIDANTVAHPEGTLYRRRWKLINENSNLKFF